MNSSIYTDSPGLRKMESMKNLMLFILLLAGSESFANSLPAWYKKELLLREVSSMALKDGKLPQTDLVLGSYKTMFQDLGSHRLFFINVVASATDKKGDWNYHVSEVYTSPPKMGQLLFKRVSKEGCDAEILKEVGVEEIGTQLKQTYYSLQLRLKAFSCPEAESPYPEVLLILKDTPKGLEKVYETPLLKEGHQRVTMDKKKIQIEVTGPTSTFINLDWNPKKKSFVFKSK